MDKKFFISIAMMLLGTTVFAQNKNNTVSWKLSFNVWNGTEYESTGFKTPVKMNNDDSCQLVIEPQSSCSCVVLFENTLGKIQLLKNSSLAAKKAVIVPGRGTDIEIEAPSGTEKIYVLVSAAPAEKIQKKIAGVKDGECVADAKGLKDELLSLKSSLSSLAELPEKPTTMGGTVRGTSPKDTAVEYDGASTYLKTITIKH